MRMSVDDISSLPLTNTDGDMHALWRLLGSAFLCLEMLHHEKQKLHFNPACLLYDKWKKQHRGFYVFVDGWQHALHGALLQLAVMVVFVLVRFASTLLATSLRLLLFVALPNRIQASRPSAGRCRVSVELEKFLCL